MALVCNVLQLSLVALSVQFARRSTVRIKDPLKEPFNPEVVKNDFSYVGNGSVDTMNFTTLFELHASGMISQPGIVSCPKPFVVVISKMPVCFPSLTIHNFLIKEIY
jgi:hypothetical protein